MKIKEDMKIPGTDIILEKGDVIRVHGKVKERAEKVLFSSKYWSLYVNSMDDYGVLANRTSVEGDLGINIMLYKDPAIDEYKIQIGVPFVVLKNGHMDEFLKYADKWADAKLFIKEIRKILAKDGYEI